MASRGMTTVLVAVTVIAAGGVAWIASRNSDAGAPAPQPLGTPAGQPFEGYVLGSDSAPVTIIEYADFQCPACARHAVLTMPDIMSRLIATGRVRWIFRDFPLVIHDKAPIAHHAAACVAEQDLFVPMHDQLFYGLSTWSPLSPRRALAQFRDYARAVGANIDSYDECMDSRRYEERIRQSVQQGFDMGVGSTPTFIINGQLEARVIPFDDFRAIVDSIAPLPGS